MEMNVTDVSKMTLVELAADTSPEGAAKIKEILEWGSDGPHTVEWVEDKAHWRDVNDWIVKNVRTLRPDEMKFIESGPACIGIVNGEIVVIPAKAQSGSSTLADKMYPRGG